MKINLLKLAFFLLTATSIAQTQTEMNDSAFVAYEKADHELNSIYKELINMLDAKESKLLITAQQNWMAYKEAHCEFEKQAFEGGSIQPIIFATCLTEVTEQRIEELKASLKTRKEY